MMWTKVDPCPQQASLMRSQSGSLSLFTEARRNEKRLSAFDAADAIEQQRGDFTGKIARKLPQLVSSHNLFTVLRKIP